MDFKEVLIDQLKKVVEFLNQQKVDYALAGGLAFSGLVVPRATMDIDILLLIQETDVPNLIDSLKKFFDKIIPHKKAMELSFFKIWRVVSVVDDKDIIIDFLLVNSEFLENVIRRAIKINFKEIELKVITLEDLILLKSSSKRSQDIADLEVIYNNLYEEIDQDYLKLWAKKLKIHVQRQ
ncbi:MAG: nucleotidyl transferase AbiEii/AbiGii toxin family protein [bacterium]